MATARKRGKTWEYRVSYKDDSGKFKEKSKGGYRTKNEAQLAGNELEIKLSQNKNILQGDIVVGDYFEDYYLTKKEHRVGSRTQANYQRSIKFVKRYFRNTPIKSVSNTNYQNMLDEYSIGRAKGTVEKFHTQLRSCFRYAHANGVIAIDPSYDVEVKFEVEAKDRDMFFLSEAELSGVLDVIRGDLKRDDVVKHLILLSVATGARFSEIVGLKFDDFDATTRSINIDKSFDHQYTFDYKPTKNKSSIRQVDIDERTNRELQAYKVDKMQQAMLTGNNPHKYLFMLHDKKPPSNNGVNKALKKACGLAGVKEITCHALRHTHASILLKNKVPVEYIAKRLGHSSVATTQKFYLHIIKELKLISDEAVNEIFSNL